MGSHNIIRKNKRGCNNTNMKIFICLVISIAYLTTCRGEYDAPTSAEVTTVKSLILSCYTGDGTGADGCTFSGGTGAITATGLRLAFHDCVGGVCDGCINLNNESNNGLSVVIDALDEVYLNTNNAIYDIMSRADYWQLAAITAIERSITVANRNCDWDNCDMPDNDMTFKWGRDDCSTSPSTDDVHTFPAATMTRTEMIDYFSDHFSMNETEVLALMGAHTLGNANRDDSGYSGSWTVDKPQYFNTGFYRLLVNTSLTWDNAAKARGSTTDKRYQFDLYDSDDTKVGIMLNTDVELVADIDVDVLSGTSCTINVDCTVATSYAQIAEWAADPTGWWEQYQAVHLKMSEMGYDDLEEVA